MFLVSFAVHLEVGLVGFGFPAARGFGKGRSLCSRCLRLSIVVVSISISLYVNLRLCGDFLNRFGIGVAGSEDPPLHWRRDL